LPSVLLFLFRFDVLHKRLYFLLDEMNDLNDQTDSEVGELSNHSQLHELLFRAVAALLHVCLAAHDLGYGNVDDTSNLINALNDFVFLETLLGDWLLH
jgi:hypothetical protein